MRTVAQIRRELQQEVAERERRRDPVRAGGGIDAWDAFSEVAAVCSRLEEELTEAEAREEERRHRPVRQAVYWAAAAAIASAVAAAGTWWQATHVQPVRVELVRPAPDPPRGPGPWRPELIAP